MEPIVIVTGASSGIGEASARLFARRGYAVALAARRGERLETIVGEIRSAGGNALAVACDLSIPGEAGRLLAAVAERWGIPDVLVNNAGIGWYGFARDMPEATARNIARVNVEGAAAVALLSLRAMAERGSGRIINVGSMMGKFAAQGSSVYAASKAWMDSFSRSLYRETRGSGVIVSLVRPGPVRTGYYAGATSGEGARPMPGGGAGIAPERVAEAILRLAGKPRRAVWVPWYCRFISVADPVFGWALDLLGPRGVAGYRD